MRTNKAALSLGLIGALMIAGCAKQPKGRVVAIVNGEEITLDEMAAELKDVPVPANVDRMALRRTLLDSMIDRKVMAQEARKQGIDKSPDYLAQKKKGEEDLIASILGHAVAQQVPLPSEEEIRQYIVTHPVQFSQRQNLLLDQVRFDAPKDRSKLDVLKDAHSMDAVIAALQSIGITPIRGGATIDTAQAEPALIAGILQVPAGEPILLPQDDHLVVGVITGRQPIVSPPEQQKVDAARALRATALLNESKSQITQLRGKAKISYEPGFAPDKPAK